MMHGMAVIALAIVLAGTSTAAPQMSPVGAGANGMHGPEGDPAYLGSLLAAKPAAPKAAVTALAQDNAPNLSQIQKTPASSNGEGAAAANVATNTAGAAQKPAALPQQVPVGAGVNGMHGPEGYPADLGSLAKVKSAATAAPSAATQQDKPPTLSQIQKAPASPNGESVAGVRAADVRNPKQHGMVAAKITHHGRKQGPGLSAMNIGSGALAGLMDAALLPPKAMDAYTVMQQQRSDTASAVLANELGATSEQAAAAAGSQRTNEVQQEQLAAATAEAAQIGFSSKDISDLAAQKSSNALAQQPIPEAATATPAHSDYLWVCMEDIVDPKDALKMGVPGPLIDVLSSTFLHDYIILGRVPQDPEGLAYHARLVVDDDAWWGRTFGEIFNKVKNAEDKMGVVKESIARVSGVATVLKADTAEIQKVSKQCFRSAEPSTCTHEQFTAKVMQYIKDHPDYNLMTRNCGTFVCNILAACSAHGGGADCSEKGCHSRLGFGSLSRGTSKHPGCNTVAYDLFGAMAPGERAAPTNTIQAGSLQEAIAGLKPTEAADRSSGGASVLPAILSNGMDAALNSVKGSGMAQGMLSNGIMAALGQAPLPR